MSFNYEREYKININKLIKSIKNQKRNTKESKLISKLKKECLQLLEEIIEFKYKPKVEGNQFFVTENKAGFNCEILNDVKKLNEIKLFLKYFYEKQFITIKIIRASIDTLWYAEHIEKTFTATKSKIPQFEYEIRESNSVKYVCYEDAIVVNSII